MKILFINNFSEIDYLNDVIYHGLENIPGIEVYTTANPDYMLSSTPLENRWNKYGTLKKRLTLPYTINKIPNIETNIEEKIKNKHYDKIFYGSVQRDLSYWQLVSSVYSKNDIFCFDGEDHTWMVDNIIPYCRYFKRELISDRTDVEPISFGIPEEKVFKIKKEKQKMFGTIYPGDESTYIFRQPGREHLKEEENYYNDYAISYYGYTTKKAGWDCIRHYEILGAYSIPCFMGLENCPSRILMSFPKEIILECNKYSLDNKIHPAYDEINEQLHEYTLNNLTPTKIVNKIL